MCDVDERWLFRATTIHTRLQPSCGNNLTRKTTSSPPIRSSTTSSASSEYYEVAAHATSKNNTAAAAAAASAYYYDPPDHHTATALAPITSNTTYFTSTTKTTSNSSCITTSSSTASKVVTSTSSPPPHLHSSTSSSRIIPAGWFPFAQCSSSSSWLFVSSSSEEYLPLLTLTLFIIIQWICISVFCQFYKFLARFSGRRRCIFRASNKHPPAAYPHVQVLSPELASKHSSSSSSSSSHVQRVVRRRDRDMDSPPRPQAVQRDLTSPRAVQRDLSSPNQQQQQQQQRDRDMVCPQEISQRRQQQQQQQEVSPRTRSAPRPSTPGRSLLLTTRSSSSSPSSSAAAAFHFSRRKSLQLFAIILVVTTLIGSTESCSSRSTPKPRAPSPTARPNVTFHTYACPPAYAAWYCLNGATCFTVKIGESLLYNCECAEGYMGQRCEFKDLDGSYLRARQKVMLEKASIAGGASIATILVVAVFAGLYIRRQRQKKSLRASDEVDRVGGLDMERRPFGRFPTPPLRMVVTHGGATPLCSGPHCAPHLSTPAHALEMAGRPDAAGELDPEKAVYAPPLPARPVMAEP